ncbi:MAG: tRNA pseudouridine(38-40) synthase TruA [Verrucomicrobiota bacterium]
MMRIKLTIAYDGRPFEGWQSQPSGRTVQDQMEAALERIAKKRISLHASGRTDTGVHALGQVAHFDAPANSSMDAAAWMRALNAHLPRTIRVMASEGVADDFHARFSVIKKTYRYEIDTSEVLRPLRAGLAWHHPQVIDRDLLRESLVLFQGEHDFAAFAANRGDGKDLETVRTIHEARLAEHGETLALTYTGNGFLYRMVRLLTGSAMRCATGGEPVRWIANLLEPAGTAHSSHCAPADGLTLVSVDY